VKKVIPYFTGRLKRAIKKGMRSKGVTVIIAESPCVAHQPPRALVPFQVKESACQGVRHCRPSCIASVGCPAIRLDEAGEKARIDAEACLGCGLCAPACPKKAIVRKIRSWRHRL
jgi:indolepyruvate ferredoxin oxidoreductase alpha subunit